jgi:hypothetical protein
MLDKVAVALPQLRPDAVPSSSPAGATEYKTSIPLRSPADDSAARSTFLRWIWYASRRAGLHLNEADDEFGTQERVDSALRIIAPTMRLTQEDHDRLLPDVRITRYGSDEPLQFAGQVPKRMSFIVNGKVRLVVSGDDGVMVPVAPSTRATSSARPHSHASR